MKRIIILFTMLIVVIIISFIVVLVKRKKLVINVDSIKFMHFSYSEGNTIYSNVSYEIDYKDNKYIATIKPNEIPLEEKKEVELDSNKLSEIIDILNKYNVVSWHNFKKYDRNVLDGNSFSFYLKTKNGNIIDASGYMKYPKNYYDVKGELDSIFNELYK